MNQIYFMLLRSILHTWARSQRAHTITGKCTFNSRVYKAQVCKAVNISSRRNRRRTASARHRHHRYHLL
ncbi:unnamed protein product [Mycena citricolor]|uniref:Uncharacterized protein n=1 Tax=Mycena citricolor TaxID=2018698 RepID=A0AAD2Q3R1_9AGAR|nr:unnamed protein product [Mycena citricolor]CAK5272813.1 unnamed protein product [Mycena citricolor]